MLQCKINGLSTYHLGNSRQYGASGTPGIAIRSLQQLDFAVFAGMGFFPGDEFADGQIGGGELATAPSTTLSSQSLARHSPSGLKAKTWTLAGWPDSTATHCRFSSRHKRTVSSSRRLSEMLPWPLANFPGRNPSISRFGAPSSATRSPVVPSRRALSASGKAGACLAARQYGFATVAKSDQRRC